MAGTDPTVTWISLRVALDLVAEVLQSASGAKRWLAELLMAGRIRCRAALAILPDGSSPESFWRWPSVAGIDINIDWQDNSAEYEYERYPQGVTVSIGGSSQTETRYHALHGVALAREDIEALLPAVAALLQPP